MTKHIPKAKNILSTVLNSYSQVFFSKSKLIIAVAVANMLALTLGYNKSFLQSGLYGFNALLVGLGIGLFYQPSIELYLLVIIAAVICFFLTVVFQGVLGKYGLPFLSVPFLITIWIIALSGSNLTALNISERSIFIYNEMYALGGLKIVDFYNLLENIIVSPFIKIYFQNLLSIVSGYFFSASFISWNYHRHWFVDLFSHYFCFVSFGIFGGFSVLQICGNRVHFAQLHLHWIQLYFNGYSLRRLLFGSKSSELWLDNLTASRCSFNRNQHATNIDVV